MIRYSQLLKEAISSREILRLSKFLKNSFNMKFVVIGGAAFSLYTGAIVNDLDIVVYDFGSISAEEVDQVIAIDNQSNLKKINLFGINIDFLSPNQKYRKNGELLFKIPNRFKNTTSIEGVSVISLIDLINMTKKKDRNFRYTTLIKMFNLDQEFINRLNKNVQKDFLDIYNDLKR